MSDTLEVIKTRYACRTFDGQPVPAQTLRAIAEAGLCAPSAMHREPWRIIVVGNKAYIEQLDAKGMAVLQVTNPGGHQRMMERGGTLFYDASAIIFVAKAPNDGAFSPDLDCGIVTANLILAARALGVDSVVCGFAGVLFEGAGASELRRQLQFPEGFDFSIAVLLGYNSGEPKAPHTPDLSKIIEID